MAIVSVWFLSLKLGYNQILRNFHKAHFYLKWVIIDGEVLIFVHIIRFTFVSLSFILLLFDIIRDNQVDIFITVIETLSASWFDKNYILSS